MPVNIISSSGTQFGLLINPDGSLNAQTTISGISIGSIVVSDVDGTMYIVSGNNVHLGSAWTNIGSTLITNFGAERDEGNSTTTMLSANGSFVGSARDIDMCSSWSTTIFADQSSATNGLKIQWSDDAGSNWDFSDTQTYSSGAGNIITFGRKARYVRLNYTNGTNAQGFFRVNSVCQPVAVRQTRKFVGNQLLDQDTGQVVISALQGHTTAGGGGWVDVKVSPGGALTTDVTGSIAITNTGSVIQATNPWIVLGSNYPLITAPTLVSSNPSFSYVYIYSGTSTGVTGSEIGSIIQFINTGSYVRTLNYSDNVLIKAGSWS